MVRRKCHADQSRPFLTKTGAKTCANRIEQEMADLEARGGSPGNESPVPR